MKSNYFAGVAVIILLICLRRRRRLKEKGRRSDTQLRGHPRPCGDTSLKV